MPSITFLGDQEEEMSHVSRELRDICCTQQITFQLSIAPMTKRSIFYRYGFAWITAGFFVVTLTGHWLFGWFAYVNQQRQHNQNPVVSEYMVEMTRDTLENWQSEFLQLIWQVAGLALLLHVGSPQSKEGDDRMEAKLDAVLLAVAPDSAEKTIKKIDDSYEGRHTDAEHAHRLAETVRQKKSG
jgi:hypothetical protein